MPEEWETYSLSYRYLNTVYRVVVVRTSLRERRPEPDVA